MSDNINFIQIDPKADEEHLIQRFQEETDTTVYPAQDTRILIQLMVYYANLLQVKFNNAAKLNLVKYSKYPILDFLGQFKDCKRLDNESDENYIKRILLAPEGFSVAGPEAAYIYYAISSDASILDAGVEVPNDDIKIQIGEDVLTMISDTAENDTIFAEADYQEGEVNLTLKQVLTQNQEIRIKVPHPFKLRICVLTENLPVDDEIISKVQASLKGNVPLLDRFEVISANKQEFTIQAKVFLTKNADENTVKTEIKNALNGYLNELKKALGKSVIVNKIKSIIMDVKGVYDVNLITPEASLPASFDTVYYGEIGEIEYEVTDND